MPLFQGKRVVEQWNGTKQLGKTWRYENQHITYLTETWEATSKVVLGGNGRFEDVKLSNFFSALRLGVSPTPEFLGISAEANILYF